MEESNTLAEMRAEEMRPQVTLAGTWSCRLPDMELDTLRPGVLREQSSAIRQLQPEVVLLKAAMRFEPHPDHRAVAGRNRGDQLPTLLPIPNTWQRVYIRTG
jgi:LmbE family N-acetylglucosaminyl deacetylase